MLQLYSVKPVVLDDENPDTRCILLNPDVKLEGTLLPETGST
jgi:hypothetical protein